MREEELYIMRPRFKDTIYQFSQKFVFIFEMFLAIIGILFLIPILDEWKGVAATIALILFMIAKTVLALSVPKLN